MIQVMLEERGEIDRVTVSDIESARVIKLTLKSGFAESKYSHPIVA